MIYYNQVGLYNKILRKNYKLENNSYDTKQQQQLWKRAAA